MCQGDIKVDISRSWKNLKLTSGGTFGPSDGKIEHENSKKLRRVGNETQTVILSLVLRSLSWISLVW